MDDRSRVALAAVLGAVLGGCWGYLYLTEGGRHLRIHIEPALDDLLGEVRRWRGTIEKARTAVDEGWRSINEIAGAPQPGAAWERGDYRPAH